jgi:signal transduction histidine kinase
MAEIRFSHIFSRELYDRLLWFGRLRWLAVSGLALASLAGPPLGVPHVWPSLFAVAAVVAGYNLVFQRRLLGRGRGGPAFGSLRAVAISLMVMDLSALMVTVHFTGGLRSPILPFFVFHMAIGTIMILTRIMYLMAAFTSLGALALYLLETSSVLAAHPLHSGETVAASSAALNLASLVATLFGVVYLTDSVTSRFKARNVELQRTTEMLQDRTDQLQDLVREMRDLERRKSHYMRISAHQLRSPLGTIKTSLQVLGEGYADPGTERGRRLLVGATERVDGLLEIVNDLLALAGIREGKAGAPWSRQVNLNQLLADLFDSLGPDAERRQVRLTPDFEGVAILEWGIPPDLVHCFENLIYNAIKYSHPGGEVTVQLRATGTEAMVWIADEGIGIPPKHLDEVFMEFVRAPNAREHTAEGTGLGLAIVREVVEAHGGRVSAKSREEEGAVFTVTLPLHRRPPEVPSLLQGGNGPGYGSHTRGGGSPAA